MASWAAADVKASSDCNANSVAMASGTVAFGMWFSCLMSGRDDNGSRCVRPAIEQTEQHVAWLNRSCRAGAESAGTSRVQTPTIPHRAYAADHPFSVRRIV